MSNFGTSPLPIVAVHGVGNSFGADVTGSRLEELRALRADTWTQQLVSGLGVSPSQVNLDFAYYADKLFSGPVAHGAGRTIY